MTVNVTTETAADTVARLRATFASGRTRSWEWREQQLDAMAAMLTDNEAEICAALADDLGKPSFEAWAGDIRIVVREIKDISKHMRRWAGDQRIKTPLFFKPGRSFTRFDPLGVVLVIAPWNYPVQLLISPLAAAVAAGNAAIAKPSELTPATSRLIARLVTDYLDNDAIAVVEGGVEETTALLEQRFDHIFYTGNGAVGRVIAAAAAKHLTPITLELGGKSPAIIDADVNLELAVQRIASARWLNAGQTCIASDHVWVHESLEAEFVERLVEQVRKRYGKDPQQSPDYARIVNDRHTQRLKGLLDAGGYDEVAVGGQVDLADRYVAPTVLRGTKPDAGVMQEEIFGPLLPILTFSDISEVIDQVNAGDKPLALYLFTNSQATIDRVLSETSSGGVGINDTLSHVMNGELPFGGVGESGTGSYHGKWGFETFSHRKAVYQRPSYFRDPPLLRPPYTKLKVGVLRKLY